MPGAIAPLGTAEALDRILAAMPELPTEAVELTAAAGRVLRQVIEAERDQPPFDRVMMDGIAISHADFAGGQRRFDVQCTQMAGDAAAELMPGQCVEIMTGASLPANADCIIPVERIATTDGAATLEEAYEPQARQFIHPRASDHAAGSHLLAPGKRIAAADVAVVASAGLVSVEVSRLPIIRVISTGNELVAAGAPIQPHQIRLSNGPAIQALLSRHGYAGCAHDHLVDERDVLRERIARHLLEADVLILSGGVSMGRADYVPEVLGELGVNVSFHRISQRPGKPMWFGTAPGGKAVFALPGNPVSALVCCRQYVIPALSKASAENSRPPEFAALTSDVTFEPALTCFQPVRLVSSAAGEILAMPVRTNTSGDFTALSGTDGYVELVLEKSNFPAGSPVLLYRW